MDRSSSETAPPRHPGLFERPPAPREVRRTRPRTDEERFDPVAFRQSSGIVRERAADEPLPVAASTSGAAVAGRTRTYLAVWLGLGLVSAGYLGGVVWQRIGAIDMALAPVTETLERLAIEIAEIRQTTAAIDARGQQMATRVAAAETRLDGFAQSAASLPQAAGLTPPNAQPGQGQRPTNRAALEAAAAPTQAKAAEPVATQRVVGIEVVQRPMPPTKQIATVAQPAAPVQAPAVNSRMTTKVVPAAPAAAQRVDDAYTSQSNPINTGSVAAGAHARPVGLLVASGPSLDSIRLSWNVLSQNHGNVLGSLEPRILPAGDGSAFQLIAGPFASDAEAQKACSALKSRGVGCRPADYAGAPL